MEQLPVFLDIQRARSLVVGGGDVARRKVDTLRRAGGQVLVVAPQIDEELVALAVAGDIEIARRAYQSTDLNNACLVVAATDDRQINQQISSDAMARHLPVNVVDDPTLCSFIMPSVIDRSPVIVAVSTGGAAPVLARVLRARLETLIPSGYGRLASLMREFREQVRRTIPNQTLRRRFWEKAVSGNVAEKIFEGKHQRAISALRSLLDNADETIETGEVYLVGGGPGDPDLLTFRALRLMQQADIVIYDRLVSPVIVDLCRKDATRIFVGKKRDQHTVQQEDINDLLVYHARAGKRVLRLKGGDPFIFGRGGEEIDTLADHNIPFQIVPGITAASGCAAYAGIPLTHRDFAQQCLFVTGHQKNGKLDLPWESLIQPRQTVAIYMGLHSMQELSDELIARGMSADTPAAMIERGTTPDQRVITASLQDLASTAQGYNIGAPTMIILGEVVSLHSKLAWL